MKQMGIKQESLDAEKVTIKTRDKNLVIENPNVVKVNMMGQETFQITGEIREERDNLDEKLQQRKTSQADIDALQEAYDEGREIRDLPTQNQERTIKWCENIQGVVDTHAPPQEAFLFRSIDDGEASGMWTRIPRRLGSLEQIIFDMIADLDKSL